MSRPADLAERPPFRPAEVGAFRFVGRDLDAGGRVRLRYGLDDVEFEERLELPAPPAGAAPDPTAVEGLLALLHWVAGVSYYKAAAPPAVRCETGPPPPAAARLLEALYSEGLGEFAMVNGLPGIPRPAFPADHGRAPGPMAAGPVRRVLVPVGGGKDSIVALEVVRRSGLDMALFSVGDPPPIARTVRVAGLPRLLAHRRLDPRLLDLNARGALNGHVPVTAIVACAALLTAALHGFDAVALANERSASAGNLTWDGVEVNHQFSKGARAERLLRDAAAESAPGLRLFSVLRPASELAIARAFARLDRYHGAFTSCNRVFRIDAARRATSWCGDCDKCRFVFLVLAPFMEPAALRAVFGADLLADPAQYPGFALLTATGGHKPFECVGEVEEAVAAVRLLAADPRWRDRPVVRRLAGEVLAGLPAGAGDPGRVLALSADHDVPAELLGQVDALLGA